MDDFEIESFSDLDSTLGVMSVTSGTGSQSVDNSGEVVISQFDTIEVDRLTDIDLSTGAITVSASGLYEIDVWLNYTSDAQSGEQYTFSIKSSEDAIVSEVINTHDSAANAYNLTMTIYDTLDEGEQVQLTVISDDSVATTFDLKNGEFGLQRVE